MRPYYESGPVTLYHGASEVVMKSFADSSIDAIVTDPPYELGFMGKGWDSSGIAYSVELWAEALRVLKPGGHLLAFGGSRTYHRMAVAIEDAGFELRDSIAWLYGSGFPKSLDVAKAIDKRRVEDLEPMRVVCRAIRAAMDAKGMRSKDLVEHFDGCHPRLIDHWAARDTDSQPSVPTLDQWAVLREVLGISDPAIAAEVERLNTRKGDVGEAWTSRDVTGEVEAWQNRTNFAMTTRDGVERARAIAGSEAEKWQGWGTALKPAFEPVVVARKPLVGTVAANVLAFGTGALNIDATRTAGENPSIARRQGSTNHLQKRSARDSEAAGKVESRTTPERYREERAGELLGRWPTNVVLDESQAAVLDAQAPKTGGSGKASGPSLREQTGASVAFGARRGLVGEPAFYGGELGGASRFFPTFKYEAKAPTSERPVVDGVAHATVKPLALMRWLVRLVTPPGGVVLDPFAGSGTTLEAAVLEGFETIGIELGEEHLPLIRHRFAKPLAQGFDLGDIA